MTTVVANFNKRIARWDRNESLIDLNAPLPADNENLITGNSTSTSNSAGTTFSNGYINNTGDNLKEVVVTGAFNIKRTARSTTSNVQYIFHEQANIIRDQNVNNALAGKVAGIQVRSQSAVKLGAAGLIRLRGENGIGIQKGVLYVLDGTIMPSSIDLNQDDIMDYTILQGPAASALFGPDGMNGAIVMNTKKARRGGGYWFAREFGCGAEDENYMEEISEASRSSLADTYEALKLKHEKHIGFYFEMARYFHRQKIAKKAMEILIEGADLCPGNDKAMQLVANILEEWKQYGKAIDIYKGLLENTPQSIQLRRELAMAYFQDRQYQQALDVLNEAVKIPATANEAGIQKDMALAEMNMIIALHRDKLDLKAINPYLIKSMPAGLRIVASTARNNLYHQGFFFITEPDGSVCSTIQQDTKNGGMLVNNGFSYEDSRQDSRFCSEYLIRNPVEGTYKLKIRTGEQSLNPIPQYTRVMIFKNFQQPNQTLEIRMAIAGKDEGEVSINDIK